MYEEVIVKRALVTLSCAFYGVCVCVYMHVHARRHGEARIQPQVLFLRSSLVFFKDKFLMRIRGLPIQLS